jgi:two-component system, LytTR family, sensor kinase
MKIRSPDKPAMQLLTNGSIYLTNGFLDSIKKQEFYPMQTRRIALFFTNRVNRNILFWMLFAFFHYYPRNNLSAYLTVLGFLAFVYGIPVYTNNLLLIPRYLVKRKFLVYLTLFLPLFAATVAESLYLNRWASSFLPPGTDMSPMSLFKWMGLPAQIFPILLLFTLMAFGKILNDAIQHQRDSERQFQQRLAAELEHLQSQINPHFLFNALNTIYGMARRTDLQTANAVLQLSDILRHSLYECGKEEIPIDQEVTVLRQYIAFNRLRLHQKDQVQFTVDVEAGQQTIAPLLLLPFIENAFKHGLGNQEEKLSQIDIDLRLSGNELWFNCSNSYYPKNPQQRKGIGLSNVQRRLQLFYPDRHHLKIGTDQEKYKVSLKIQLT